MSHNSSCYDPNIIFPCPKKTIVMSHNSSWRDQKLTSPVPKKHLVQSQNLSCYDHKSTSPVPKSDIVLSYISSCYDPISTSPVPKVTSLGWLVGVLKGIGTGHIQDNFHARTNCCFLRWNQKEWLGWYQQRMFNIQYEELMMLKIYNTKSSMLYNLLKLDEAWCFILDELLDKTTVQGQSAAWERSAVLL